MRVGFRTPAIALAPDRADGGAEDRLQRKLRRVAFQIVDKLCARRIAPEGGRHLETRQRGDRPRRMQMQPVVMAPPDRAHALSLFENDGLKSAGVQLASRGKAGGAGAYDDCVWTVHPGAPIHHDSEKTTAPFWRQRDGFA